MRLLPYLCVALWGTWLFAVQGWWAAGHAHSGLVPDLGAVLLLAIAARCELQRTLWVALVLGLARAAQSADPAAAILLGYLLLALAVAPVAATLDLDRPWLRAMLGALGGAALARWLALCADLRAPSTFLSAAEQGPGSWYVGLATAAVALVIGRRLRHLPGLGPLWREEGPWQLAARGR